MQGRFNKIPKSFGWLIDRSIPDADVRHLKGDYEEIYDGIFRNHGRIRAYSWVLRQILISAVQNGFESIVWSWIMIKNYIIIAFRNFSRHKTYSFINITGLAIGLACTIFIFQWVLDELSYDRFHENADRLYVATFSNGSKVTPSALGPFLKTEYPEIANTARFIGMNRNLFKYGEKQINHTGGVMADPAFVEMFTFRFLQGDPKTALSDPYSIVISENLATKLFGSENPMNKTITLEVYFDIKVTGVFADYPRNSHIECEYIIPLAASLLSGMRTNLNTWAWNDLRTYVQLHDRSSVETLNLKISDVVERHRPQDQRPLALQPITRLHLYYFNRNDGPILFVYLFSTLAFFILLIACINFMNLTTARSTNRAKEVGVRKVVGARKLYLIRQFFSETLLLTALSVIVAILLVVLFLPMFNNLTGKFFTAGFLLKRTTIFGITGITLFTALVAGSYPALFLSHFQPLKVMRGMLATGRRGVRFRKILVVVQFSLSVLLFIGTLMVYRQIKLMRERPLGLEKENIVYFSIGGRFTRNIETIKARMHGNPNILSMTLTNIAPYRWNTNAGYGDVQWEGKSHQRVKMVVTSLDEDYVETFGLKMVQGRFFQKDIATDASDSWVVNEAAVRAMEIDGPIGKELRIWELKGRIIGVVKDYHFESLHNEIIPMAMRLRPAHFAQACVRINPAQMTAALNFLEETWKEIYPEHPFEYQFLDDTINSQYRVEEAVGRLIEIFSFLAILISCLGLFGLASFTAERRTKEIGIRKTCGASMPGLLVLISKESLRLVLLACLIGIPVAAFLTGKLLRNYPYRISFSVSVILLTCSSILGIAILTVLYHTLRAARANPVESLRYE